MSDDGFEATYAHMAGAVVRRADDDDVSDEQLARSLTELALEPRRARKIFDWNVVFGAHAGPTPPCAAYVADEIRRHVSAGGRLLMLYDAVRFQTLHAAITPMGSPSSILREVRVPGNVEDDIQSCVRQGFWTVSEGDAVLALARHHIDAGCE